MKRPLERIFAPGGALSEAVPGFKLRPQQLEMAEAIHGAIERQGVLVAEAGTGTGKTFAYLVPALLAGGKVIVSTGTKNLQDQLFDRDLPAVRKALASGASTALETRRLLAPSLAPRLTRPGMLNTTWKLPTSAAACCSSARSETASIFLCAGASRISGARASSRPPLADAGARGGGGGYCTISEFRSGALPPRAVRTVETLSATLDQSSPVFWVISARRTSSSAGLRSLAPVSRRAS